MHPPVAKFPCIPERLLVTSTNLRPKRYSIQKLALQSIFLTARELKTALAQIVARQNTALDERRERLLRLCTLFLELYGDGPVSLLRAPARINVLGEHIDYVSYLPTASLTFGSRERDVLMLYRKADHPRVRGASTAANYEASSFDILEDQVPAFGPNAAADWLSFLSDHHLTPAHWQNYVRGAVTFARGKFPNEIKFGFDFAIDSNVPAGGGASSSSTLVVLGGAAIREVNDLSFSPKELADDSALAEWYIGTRGGSMDHTTICLAQPAQALVIDYSGGTVRHVSLPDEPFCWVTFFTKPADKGSKVMLEYNERVAVSRLLIPALLPAPIASLEALDPVEDLLMSLPETISIDTLRVRYPETFSELERSFPALLNDAPRWPLQLRSRALHHLGEVRRVSLATRILETIQSGATSETRLDVMQHLGKLINESHASLRDLYGVSTPEVEQLIDLVRSDPNVLGARLMGGGFGGNILALTTKEHADSLIQRVQQQYYQPQHRDGVDEGSVMISTPGDGLRHVEWNEKWLLDALPRVVSQEIWPVIVAAGKGTRASATGVDVPKPVALIKGEPAIVHVLNNLRKGLGQTRPPVIIVSPETEAAVRQALKDQQVTFITQPEALGTGDAVLQAHQVMHDFTGLTLVVWSTQPVIQAETFERTAKLAVLQPYDMIVPTAFRADPYAPIKRNQSGAVQSASETHLESAEAVAFGETNIGMFLLKNQAMFAVLLDLRNRYWNESTHSYDRSRGELGFPNELINRLAGQRHGVFACPIADWREEQGIKRLEDLSVCERFISELKKEKPAIVS
jgi:galactokinase/CTP:molybdopterin cytidylyltransferase MocA